MNLSFRRQSEQRRSDAKKKGMPWREYWHLYLSLFGTGILTAFAGVYLGLAPDPDGSIVFLSTWDMARRVFFAIYYAGSFLLVAEGATLFAKDKLLNRDVEEIDGRIEDVKAQRVSASVMLYVSVLAIVMTTVAAGTMLASWLGALNEFLTIPKAAQEWIVLGPPALLVFDTVCALIYQQNSKQSELDRWVQQQQRMSEATAREAWAKEYSRLYSEEAPRAARAAARVAAMREARKWGGSEVDEIAEVVERTQFDVPKSEIAALIDAQVPDSIKAMKVAEQAAVDEFSEKVAALPVMDKPKPEIFPEPVMDEPSVTVDVSAITDQPASPGGGDDQGSPT